MASIKHRHAFTVTSALLGTGLAVSSGCTEKPPVQINPGPVEVPEEEKKSEEKTTTTPESTPDSAPESAKAPAPIINPGPVPVPVEPTEPPKTP